MYDYANQAIREDITDTLIDNDTYFLMDDPTPFLDWAVQEHGNWVDLDIHDVPVIDYVGMLTHWLEQEACNA